MYLELQSVVYLWTYLNSFLNISMCGYLNKIFLRDYWRGNYLFLCDVFTAVTSDVCSSPTSNLDLLFCLLGTSSVILVTDNVTKAAQVGIQMELTKHIGTEMLLVNFRLALFYLLFWILSQAVACTLLLQDLLKLQSLYRLVITATWTNNTGSFTSPRCDIPTPTVTTRFRMQSVNAPLVYSNEIEFIRQLRPQLAVMV
jgi:hypothetical protein